MAPTERAATERVSYTPVEGADRLFTPAFLEYLVRLHDEFTPRVRALLAERAAVLERALRQGILPAPLPPARPPPAGWAVPPVPADLLRPGIEISGPCSITSMFINALNPGPEGERAEGDLDDDEDSAGHRLVDTVRACQNRLGAVNRELSLTDRERGREYRIARRRTAVLHAPRAGTSPRRARGDGRRGAQCPPRILGTALTLYYPGRAQADRGQGIYFYLPKVESAEECAWYRDLFDRSRGLLPFLGSAVIRAVPLVESLPAVYQMEEMLHALGPYGAGLNAARWDLKASIFEFVMADPRSVWPDRFGVDIKTTPFLANIFRRLVAVCLKRGAVPIGGMATALPSNDPEVNRVAAEAISADKVWEAEQGFIRAWVAHIFHMKTAGGSLQDAPCLRLEADGGDGGSRPLPDPDRGAGRADHGRGHAAERADGDRVPGGVARPGAAPRASTAWPASRASIPRSWRISRPAACRWPRSPSASAIARGRRDGPATVHDFALVKRLLDEECRGHPRAAARPEGRRGARRATARRLKIAMRWIKNYTELDFRSLGLLHARRSGEDRRRARRL